VLGSQNIYCKWYSEQIGGFAGQKMHTSTTCEVSNLNDSKSMDKIGSWKVLWTGRVLELGARKVPRLLTIGTALVSQQVVEQVAEPVRSIGRGVLIEGHAEHTVGRGTMVFANGWGGGTQSEWKIMRCGRQWCSPRPVVEEDRLLLASEDLLDRGAWAAALAINIRHVITDRESVSRMNPVDGRFDSVDVVDGSGTRDVGRVGGAPLRPRNWDGLGGGLCGIYRSLATVGKLA